MLKIANAPCSWGVLEFSETKKELTTPLTPEKFLTELRESGFRGTELGDDGFLPNKPKDLNKLLDNYGVSLAGAFLPVALTDKGAEQSGIDRAILLSNLMKDAGYEDAVIVLSDDNCKIPERTKNTGRIQPHMEPSKDQWQQILHSTQSIAEKVATTGIKVAFHHHCGGYIETPEEISYLMNNTNKDILGLCLDTGHYQFGGGDPLDAIETYGDRINHVHFKDFSRRAFRDVMLNDGDYFNAIANGIFCQLGEGSVNFSEIYNKLIERNYSGWIVVEQDVIPGMGNPFDCATSAYKYMTLLKEEAKL
ncbi:TIM barrel protein [Bacteriovoracaceae bacterium]|nr:TIM barrel protein [Bacteriovoracaceae bacterium]